MVARQKSFHFRELYEMTMECDILYKLFLLISTVVSALAMDYRKPYIIHMDESALPASYSHHHDWYTSLLSSLSSPDEIDPTHLYTHDHVLNGFVVLHVHLKGCCLVLLVAGIDLALFRGSFCTFSVHIREYDGLCSSFGEG